MVIRLSWAEIKVLSASNCRVGGKDNYNMQERRIDKTEKNCSH
jgi:hypothetical protein